MKHKDEARLEPHICETDDGKRCNICGKFFVPPAVSSPDRAEELAREILEFYYSGTSPEKPFNVENVAALLRPHLERAERRCSMHGDKCLGSGEHHFLKYHDPESEFYIGNECVNCCYSEVLSRLPAAPDTEKP